jgi:hypothetical protein
MSLESCHAGLAGMTGESGKNLLDYAMDGFLCGLLIRTEIISWPTLVKGGLKDFYGSGDEEFVEEHDLEFDKKAEINSVWWRLAFTGVW